MNSYISKISATDRVSIIPLGKGGDILESVGERNDEQVHKEETITQIMNIKNR